MGPSPHPDLPPSHQGQHWEVRADDSHVLGKRKRVPDYNNDAWLSKRRANAGNQEMVTPNAVGLSYPDFGQSKHICQSQRAFGGGHGCTKCGETRSDNNELKDHLLNQNNIRRDNSRNSIHRDHTGVDIVAQNWHHLYGWPEKFIVVSDKRALDIHYYKILMELKFNDLTLLCSMLYNVKTHLCQRLTKEGKSIGDNVV